MKPYIFLSLLFVIVVSSCGVQKPATMSSGIVGSWQGCDGRIVTFTQKGDSIIGRYTTLGGLERFGFAQDEIGHKLSSEEDGSYVGLVKWRAINIKQPTWRAVKVTINGNIYQDKGSDRCGRDMTRFNTK